VLSDVVEYLICPVCRDELVLGGSSVGCRNGHSFDVARQGYVNLSVGDRHAALGDTAEMVQARAEFLGRGHFSPLTEFLAKEAARVVTGSHGCVVDVGAGTGYYLAGVLNSMPGRVGLALDASKYAARHAARSHERAGAVVCDAWEQLPVRSSAATVALNVFAPRNSGELHRILSPAGSLIVVTPSEGHLEQLVTTLELLTVDEFKERRLEEKLGPHFSIDRRTQLEFRMDLRHDEVGALVAMGPSAWHTHTDEIRGRIATFPDPVEVVASMSISVYRPH
jgi:23S rRNA (guanine745-N1)-methyltransferase